MVWSCWQEVLRSRFFSIDVPIVEDSLAEAEVIIAPIVENDSISFPFIAPQAHNIEGSLVQRELAARSAD